MRTIKKLLDCASQTGYFLTVHRPLEIVPTEDVVSAIQEAANTGEPGDGKIFVMAVEDPLQIRTGESGPAAV